MRWKVENLEVSPTEADIDPDSQTPTGNGILTQEGFRSKQNDWD
jgi:hypothetical protein